MDKYSKGKKVNFNNGVAKITAVNPDGTATLNWVKPPNTVINGAKQLKGGFAGTLPAIHTRNKNLTQTQVETKADNNSKGKKVNFNNGVAKITAFNSDGTATLNWVKPPNTVINGAKQLKGGFAGTLPAAPYTDSDLNQKVNFNNGVAKITAVNPDGTATLNWVKPPLNTVINGAKQLKGGFAGTLPAVPYADSDLNQSAKNNTYESYTSNSQKDID